MMNAICEMNNNSKSGRPSKTLMLAPRVFVMAGHAVKDKHAQRDGDDLS